MCVVLSCLGNGLTVVQHFTRAFDLWIIWKFTHLIVYVFIGLFNFVKQYDSFNLVVLMIVCHSMLVF